VESLDKEALTDIHSLNVDEERCFDDWLSLADHQLGSFWIHSMSSSSHKAS